MKTTFCFYDKNEYEADIIADFLAQEKIPFKTSEHKEPIYCDCEDDEPCDYISIYDIYCLTDLKHYDYVKVITSKKINKMNNLNKVFYSKDGKRSKKVIARMEKVLNDKNLCNRNGK